MSSLCANILRTLGTWGRVCSVISGHLHIVRDLGQNHDLGLGFDGDRRDGVDTGSISTRTGYETVERYIIDAPIRARNRRWFAAYTPGIAPYVPYTRWGGGILPNREVDALMPSGHQRINAPCVPPNPSQDPATHSTLLKHLIPDGVLKSHPFSTTLGSRRGPFKIRSEKLRIRVYGTGRYGPAPYTYGGSRVQPQGLRWKRKSTLARVRIGYTPRREATGTTYVVPELHQCEGWQAADVFSVRRWVPGCCAYTGGHFNTLSHIPKWRVPPLDAKAAHQSKCAVLCPNVLPS
ncbi:hypothetical protein B0H11DRAFT_1907704 [Mycena galericulata]|nr:hypothetical protein B0H11DRAFT_1907704 [Mycena galericulata]